MTSSSRLARPPAPADISRRQRGSLLLVAMLLAAVIGISLVSYLRLCNATLISAHRNYLNTAAMNLCELGLENALLCVNNNETQGVSLTAAWSGWTVINHDARRSFSGYQPAPNATGSVKVYVQNYDLGAQPLIISQSTIIPGDGSPPLSKFVTVTLTKRSTVYGMIAKTSFTGDSNTYIDSWNSAGTGAAFVPYSNGQRKANGAVGVLAKSNGALNLGDNPTIYGTVNTGGGTPSETGNAILANSTSGRGWNAALVNTSFSYNWPPVSVPNPAASEVNLVNANISGNIHLPGPSDIKASDGKYYYRFATGVGIMYAANQMLISEPCVFMATNHAGVDVIHTSDHATFIYSANGSLDIYTNGNIEFDSGANFFNNKSAARTNIYGTSTTTQQIETEGGGTFYANIVAPNAAVEFDSGVDYMGAMAVNSISLRGGCGFHYDEALNGAGNGGYKVSQWKELKTSADRAAYSGQLAF